MILSVQLEGVKQTLDRAPVVSHGSWGISRSPVGIPDASGLRITLTVVLVDAPGVVWLDIIELGSSCPL